MVLNEAMLLGKPVIATSAVGAAFDMIVEGENGFIIPERDVDSLASSLGDIISDKKMAEKMGGESLKIITNRFRYSHMVDGFKKAVKFALRKR
jgi:glycosyltransferase involved in cell wall biosynthesis